MRKYALLLTMLVPLFFVACSSDDPEVPVEPTPPVVEDEHVSFSATLSDMSRATDTNFDQGDEISVFSVESSGSDNKGVIENSGNYAENVKYHYEGSKFTATNGILIEKNKKKYYYHAVYPYVSNAANKFKFTVKTDQQGDNYTLSDLATAHTSATSDLLVPLKFSHRLSKLVVELKGDNWPADVSLKLKNVRTSANVDLNSLTFDAGDERSDVIFANNGTKSYKVVIPPQAFTGGDDFIEFTIGGKKTIYKVPQCFDIHSGQQKTYQVEYSSKTGLVEFTGDINPWEGEADSYINDMIPSEALETVEKNMPIYRGSTPPKINNVFVLKGMKVSYSGSTQIINVGTAMSTTYVRFTSQSSTTVSYEAKSESSVESGTAYISGHDNFFTTCVYVTRMVSSVRSKVAVIISGEMTASGIKDMYYTEVLVEKSTDIEHILVDVNICVVYKTTTVCVVSKWPGVNLEDIISHDILVKIKGHITIHDGENPPKVEGVYLVDPFVLVYASDNYESEENFASLYMKFTNQNLVTNQLDYVEKQGASHTEGKGSYISGHNNYFTAFFNTFTRRDDKSGAEDKAITVISGQKTNEGLRDLEYGFVILDKYDPNNKLMNVGEFRIFKDEDGLAVNTSWSKSLASPQVSKGRILWDAKSYVK